MPGKIDQPGYHPTAGHGARQRYGRPRRSAGTVAIDPKTTYNAALMVIERSQRVRGLKVALDDFFTCLTEDR